MTETFYWVTTMASQEMRARLDQPAHVSQCLVGAVATSRAAFGRLLADKLGGASATSWAREAREYGGTLANVPDGAQAGVLYMQPLNYGRGGWTPVDPAQTPAPRQRKRLEWEQERYCLVGRAGGFRLFSVMYGTKRSDTMWTLSTDLPVKGKLLGQVHESQEAAQAAAERVLAAFLARVDGQTP